MINKTTKQRLAFQGAREASKLRMQQGIDKDAPLCIYDLIEKLGVELHFLAINSFGGMFVKDQNAILAPSLRHFGKQSFSCAHELGHWRFNHGIRVDTLEEFEQATRDDPNEFLADSFAGHLLMPLWAVQRVFTRREWPIQTITPIRAYIASCQLGVSYSALLWHMYLSLNLISKQTVEALLKTTPKNIRESILGKDLCERLVIVDEKWESVAIDVQIGDYLILPKGSIAETHAVQLIDNHELGVIAKATRAGKCQIASPDNEWSAFVRISKKEYAGRGIFRHLEDPENL